MPYMIVCGGCKKKLRIPDNMVGKTIKCPGCARKMVFKPKAPKGDAPKGGSPVPEMAGAKTAGATKKAVTAAKSSPLPAAKKSVVAKTPPAKAPAAKTPTKAPAAKAPPAPKAPPKFEAPDEAPDESPAPPPVSKPTFTPPKPAPKPTLKKKAADDDEGGKSRPLFLAIGGVILVGGIFWYLFLSGSGDGTVTGDISLNGEPLAGAKILFSGEGDNSKFQGMGISGESGRYKIHGNKGEGELPAGKYKVTVTKEGLKDGTVPTGEKMEQARLNMLLINILPKIYEDRGATPLQFDVRVGSNTFSIKLEGKADLKSKAS